MAQYVSVNMTSSKSQFNKSRLRTKTGTEVSILMMKLMYQ